MGFKLFESSGTFKPADYGLNIGDEIFVICVGAGGGGGGIATSESAAITSGSPGGASSFGSFLSCAGGAAGGAKPGTAGHFSGGAGTPNSSADCEMTANIGGTSTFCGFGGGGADGLVLGKLMGRQGTIPVIEAMVNVYGSPSETGISSFINALGKMWPLAYATRAAIGTSTISTTKCNTVTGKARPGQGYSRPYMGGSGNSTAAAFAGAAGEGYGAGGGGGAKAGGGYYCSCRGAAGGSCGEIKSISIKLSSSSTVSVTVGTGGAGANVDAAGGAGANGCVAIFW